MAVALCGGDAERAWARVKKLSDTAKSVFCAKGCKTQCAEL